MPGLVGIAQRGRSLGMHLVLATQRPAGVVSPEIRANCTLRICLRTTDEADSRDVLGTPDAAHLPVDYPGRAYVRSGSGGPRAAPGGPRLAAAGPARRGPRGRARGPGRRASRPDARAPARQRAQRPGDRVSGTAARSRRDRGAAPAPAVAPTAAGPRSPVDRTPRLDRPRTTGSTARCSLGLVDRPDRAGPGAARPRPRRGRRVAGGGGPRSGRTTLLRSVLREAVRRPGPDGLHVHVLDLGGGALAAGGAAAAARRHGDRRGGRPTASSAWSTAWVRRWTPDGPARRQTGARHPAAGGRGRGGLHAARRRPTRPAARRRCCGWCGTAPRSGLTCVLTADRAVPGRPAGRRRGPATGPAPAGPRRLRRRGRARAGRSRRSASARPGAASARRRWSASSPCPPAAASRAARDRRRSARRRRPDLLRIVELPPDPVLAAIGRSARRTSRRAALRVTVGPGRRRGRRPGGRPRCAAADCSSSDPPGSGRTRRARRLRAATCAAAEVPVLGAAPPSDARRDPSAGWDTDPPRCRRLVGSWRATRRRAAPTTSAPRGARRPSPACRGRGRRRGRVLVAAGSAGLLSTHYQGPVAALRRARTRPAALPRAGRRRRPRVRLPRTPLPVRPGSGWLVAEGVRRPGCRWRTAPRRGLTPAGQSSSSTGPISCVAYQASS